MQAFNIVQTLILSDFVLNTRQNYQMDIRSYIYSTSYIKATTQPVTTKLFKEWATNKIMGLSISRQDQIQFNIVAAYFSAIHFYYTDHKYSLAPFNTHHIKFFLQSGKSLFLAIKTIQLPIIKQILAPIITILPIIINKLNLDMVFKVVWPDFMQMGKIPYTKAEKQIPSFKDLYLTCFDINFSL